MRRNVIDDFLTQSFSHLTENPLDLKPRVHINSGNEAKITEQINDLSKLAKRINKYESFLSLQYQIKKDIYDFINKIKHCDLDEGSGRLDSTEVYELSSDVTFMVKEAEGHLEYLDKSYDHHLNQKDKKNKICYVNTR